MERILLMGYFGAGNFGDDALLLDWLIRRADWLKQRQFLADVLYNGGDPLAGFSGSQKLRDSIGSLVAKQQALKLDPHQYCALIAPGGSLLQDTTSLRSLLFYLLLIWRFTRARVPVYLLNQGLGPITSWTGRVITPGILGRASLISLRDEPSFLWAKLQRALSRHRDVLLACDPVLSGALAGHAGGTLPGDAAAGSYVLVLPRATGDLPTPRDSTTEAQALAMLVEHARLITGTAPRLYAVHRGRDEQFCAEINEAGSFDAGIASVAAQEEYPDSSLWRMIGNAALVISYRLHGLVCAAAQGVPALGVAYDPKVSAFCEDVGYPWCFPATVHHEDTLAAVEQLWNNRSQVLAETSRQVNSMLNRLKAAEGRFDEKWQADHAS